MVMVDTTADTTVDTTVDTILITEVPTMPDITMVGMMDTTMAAGAIIRIITISMDISIAGIPPDIHIVPKRPLVAPRDPPPVIPGTGAVPLNQRKHQLPHAPTQHITTLQHRGRKEPSRTTELETMGAVLQTMPLKDR